MVLKITCSSRSWNRHVVLKCLPWGRMGGPHSPRRRAVWHSSALGRCTARRLGARIATVWYHTLFAAQIRLEISECKKQVSANISEGVAIHTCRVYIFGPQQLMYGAFYELDVHINKHGWEKLRLISIWADNWISKTKKTVHSTLIKTITPLLSCLSCTFAAALLASTITATVRSDCTCQYYVYSTIDCRH